MGFLFINFSLFFLLFLESILVFSFLPSHYFCSLFSCFHFILLLLPFYPTIYFHFILLFTSILSYYLHPFYPTIYFHLFPTIYFHLFPTIYFILILLFTSFFILLFTSIVSYYLLPFYPTIYFHFILLFTSIYFLLFTSILSYYLLSFFLIFLFSILYLLSQYLQYFNKILSDNEAIKMQNFKFAVHLTNYNIFSIYKRGRGYNSS